MIGEFARAYLDELKQLYSEVSLEKLNRVAQVLMEAQQSGRKVFIFGNGGSAATATHMACDLVKTAGVSGQRGLRAISLSDNVSAMTAWANDAGYECVFQEQLANLLDPGDVAIGISASGNSPNVLRAIEYANQHGATTIGFIGFGGGRLREMVTIDVTVSSRDYGQVEDFHLTLDHILAQYLKQHIAAKSQLPRAAAAALPK